MINNIFRKFWPALLSFCLIGAAVQACGQSNKMIIGKWQPIKAVRLSDSTELPYSIDIEFKEGGIVLQSDGLFKDNFEIDGVKLRIRKEVLLIEKLTPTELVLCKFDNVEKEKKSKLLFFKKAVSR